MADKRKGDKHTDKEARTFNLIDHPDLRMDRRHPENKNDNRKGERRQSILENGRRFEPIDEIDICKPLDAPYLPGAAHRSGKELQPINLIKALEKSLELQSHYATLLNQYDIGEHMIFNTVDKWTERLRRLNPAPKKFGG